MKTVRDDFQDRSPPVPSSRRWNRNPRPQPQKFSKLVFLIEVSEQYSCLNWLSGAPVGVRDSISSAIQSVFWLPPDFHTSSSSSSSSGSSSSGSSRQQVVGSRQQVLGSSSSIVICSVSVIIISYIILPPGHVRGRRVAHGEAQRQRGGPCRTVYYSKIDDYYYYHICNYVSMQLCVYTYIHICKYIYMYIYIYAYTHTYMIHVCNYIYIYIHIYMHRNMYTKLYDTF